MLNVSSRTLAQLNLSVRDVAAYVRDRGWQKISHKNKNLSVFEGPADDCGNPIYLILPSHDDFGDTPLRLAQAIDLLANVENCSIDRVIANIQNH